MVISLQQSINLVCIAFEVVAASSWELQVMTLAVVYPQSITNVTLLLLCNAVYIMLVVQNRLCLKFLPQKSPNVPCPGISLTAHHQYTITCLLALVWGFSETSAQSVFSIMLGTQGVIDTVTYHYEWPRLSLLFLVSHSLPSLLLTQILCFMVETPKVSAFG